MGSFRASTAIIEARAGVDPPQVLEVARLAVAGGWVVEDAFVDVEALARGTGAPRVVVRFVVPTGSDAEEDAEAWSAAKVLAAAVGRVAQWNDLRVLRRRGGRWVPVEQQPNRTPPPP